MTTRWNCDSCTYLNPATSQFCVMCDAIQASPYLLKEEYTKEEEEAIMKEKEEELERKQRQSEEKKNQFRELFAAVHPEVLASGGELPNGADELLFTTEEREKRSKKRKLLDGSGSPSGETMSVDDNDSYLVQSELEKYKARVEELELQITDLKQNLFKEQEEHDVIKVKYGDLRRKLTMLTSTD
eukprot:TRINITY_DN2675_c0_g1_i1.p1 TRINITY_DN2675_c0_g1~~TRINITY_DN2675_c0_g1_i1.p1  ORF type:complete len:206 (-),score=53.75 TRINITY_DN2675_c0_g1_i1:51-605(-)